MSGPQSPSTPPPPSARLDAAAWLARAVTESRSRQARAALADASGIRDEELLEQLRRLGFTPAALPGLELVPPILVGWADGAMARLERDRLRALAVTRGLADAHPSWGLLQHWMLQCPSADERAALLGALAWRLDRLPVRARWRKQQAILRDCDAIARAAGPRLGGPRVSSDERDAMRSITDALLGRDRSGVAGRDPWGPPA